MNWFDDESYDWDYNLPYPDKYRVGAVWYITHAMKEVSYQST